MSVNTARSEEEYKAQKARRQSAQALVWRVVYTKSRAEKATAQKLNELGIEAYCPLRTIRKKWSDRYQNVQVPLFSSYCFVRVSELQRRDVFRAAGVVQYVFWQGQPAAIRDHEIEEIQRWLNDYENEFIETRSFKASETVILKDGAFAGQTATITKKSGNQLVLILAELGVQLVTHINQVELEKK